MPGRERITEAHIELAVFEYEAHYNYGRDGGGYGYRSRRFPRLSLIERVYRGAAAKKHGRGARLWFVDGEECASLSEAVERLNADAELTDEERAAIEHVPVDYAELRAIEAKIGGYDPDEPRVGAVMPGTPRSKAIRLMHALRVKGQIEYLPRPPRKEGTIPLLDGEPFTPMVRRFRQDREET